MLAAMEGTPLAMWVGTADSTMFGDALGTDVAVSLGDSESLTLGVKL